MISFLISAINSGLLIFCAVFLLFLIYCVVLNKFETPEVQFTEQITEMPLTPSDAENIPYVYVNKSILPQNNKVTGKIYEETINKYKEAANEYKEPVNKYKEAANEYKEPVKIYKVNDSEFTEEILCDDCLVQFEVSTEKGVQLKMEHYYDEYCSTPTDSESECEEDTQHMKVTLQQVPHGYVVNSTVYLTDHQWNTLTFVDHKTIQCVVCDFCCDLESWSEHVKTESHRRNLDAYPPLEEFDLSCTRKIRKNYHCAVCNELFDSSDNLDHFGSKMHEGNFLFAINKASDIMYDYNLTSDKNPFNHQKNTEDDDRHAFINFQNNYDDSEIELPQTGISYAKMAKTPKVNTQQFLEIDLGSKRVRVRFDSWHMVICPQANKFYCMVCKMFDHVRLKAEHCSEALHLEKLKKCTVVEAYEEYFIRQVDDKLYHCGHCNNLQLIHEMIDHVETNHPRKTKIVANIINPTPVKDKENRNVINENRNVNRNTNNENINTINNENKTVINDKRNVINDRNINDNNNTNVTRNLFNDNDKVTQQNNGTIKKTNVQTIVKKDNSRNMNNDKEDTARNVNKDKDNIINIKMAGIYDNIIIYPFGYKLNIPLLSYNIVCKRPTDFYCGICDFVCSEEVISKHMYEMGHIELLQRTPFILPFSCHLIRAIRDALHCAICNRPETADKIYQHIRSPEHISMLTKALRVTEPKHEQTFRDVKIPTVQSPNPVQNVNIPTFRAPNPVQNVNIPTFHAPNAVQNVNRPAFYGPNSVKEKLTIFQGQTAHDLSIPNSKPVQNVNIPNLQVTKPVQNVNTPTFQAPKPVQNVNTPAFQAPKPVQNVNTPTFQAPKPVQNINTSTFQAPKPVQNVNTPTFQAPKPVQKVNTPTFQAPIPVQNVKNTLPVQNYNIPTVLNGIPNNPKAVDVNKESLYDIKNNIKEDNIDINKKTQNEHIKVKKNQIEDLEVNEDFDNIFEFEQAVFDSEEYVYLKLRNTYIKIANSSYNTMVQIGDGTRYCFVCASQIEFIELQQHVDSRGHLKNMEKYRFLDKYEDHLLRQIYLMYHCAICNVIISRKELKTHLEWSTHALQNENTMKNIKKQRKNEIKGGIKQIIVSTQKENIYLNEKETKIKIGMNVIVTNEKTETKTSTRKNKIIILHDNVLKISWESWHGVSKVKNGYKCNLCQREFGASEIETHCESEWHVHGLEKPFEKQYAPALIRKINETTQNCLICNTEVSNKEHIIREHITGKRHAKQYDAILNDSSASNTYTDCDDDVLII